MSSDFGFGGAKKPKGLNLGGVPKGPVVVDAVREAVAVERGEGLGFTDRGQGRGGRRRRPPPVPSKPLFIRGPVDIIDWFEDYTERAGHRALWQSLADFRAMVDGK